MADHAVSRNQYVSIMPANKHIHEWEIGELVSEATCQKPAVYNRECSICNITDTIENGEKVLLFRQKKAYADLALQHTLSSPDTAYRIVHKAYDKILIDLAVEEYMLAML